MILRHNKEEQWHLQWQVNVPFANCFLCHSYVTRISFVCTFLRVTRMTFICHSNVIRMSLVCHSYVTYMYLYVVSLYSYFIHISLECQSDVIGCTRMSHSFVTAYTCMSSVCHSYELVCHSFVACIPFVCHSCVLAWHSYVTGLYS